MVSEFGDAPRALAENFYSKTHGGDSEQLSMQAAQLLQATDFRPGQQLRNEFDQYMVDNHLVNDLILFESNSIDGMDLGSGKANPKDGKLTSEEVAAAMNVGSTDLYLQTALQYLAPRVANLAPDQGISITDLNNDSLQHPTTIPTANEIQVTSQVPDLYTFAGLPSDSPVMPAPYPSFRGVVPQSSELPADAPLLAKEFQNLDTDGSGGVSYLEMLTGTESTNASTKKAAEIANDRALNYINGNGAMAEDFTMDDVMRDAQWHPEDVNPPIEQPIVTPVSPGDSLSTLSSPTATTEDQLKAIKTLVQNGQTTATITDSDGNTLNVRMEVLPIAGTDRSMVQMFAVDPSTGKQTVILRAINDGDAFTHQKDENGNEVEFVGSKWKRNHPDSIFST